MNQPTEHRAIVDQIALAFENAWNIDLSADKLLDFHAQYPCDELLEYIVGADCELARNQGVHRDHRYYEHVFPNKHSVIRSALSDKGPEEPRELLTSLSEAPLSDSSAFFESLPCTFGKYRVVRCIGQGGMAAIFEAEADQCTVALKLPYRQVRGAQRFRDRFQKEIRLLSSLAHPNIVPILESGTVEGLSFYTMLLIDGEGLDQKCTLERFETLSPRQSAEYILEATRAIAFAHAHGILHRDVKPANILVDSRNHVWVVDFGLATVTDSNQTLTGEGKLLGTPTWMPPEQACGDYSSVDVRSDVYSLGATLYTLLTGRAPFGGLSTAQLLYNIQRQELKPPRHLVRRVPVPLQNIVLKCMEKEPRLRYPTADALAADLMAYLNGAKVQAQPRNIAVRGYRWCRLYPRWFVGSAGLLLTLIFLGVTTLVFRHIASLNRQVAANALVIRDEAIRAEARQKKLLVEADISKRKAEDATNFAHAQQMRSAFANMESQRQAGRQSNLDDLYLYPARQSIDTEWYTQFQSQRPRLVREFCMGHWGLYDVALEHHGKLLATVGREGDLAIWDVETESLKKYCRFAERDPDKGFAWIRWRYDAGMTDGFYPSSPPQFLSSVAWTSNGTLLATGIDGQLLEFDLGADQPRTIYRCLNTLHFVRADREGEQFLLVDDLGNCQLLNREGEVLFQFQSETRPSWVGHAASLEAWVVAGINGELVILDRELKRRGGFNMGSRIHDVRFIRSNLTTALIATAENPLQLYRFEQNEDQIELRLVKEFVGATSDKSKGNHQALIDDHSDQVIALSDDGRITMWDEESSKPFEFQHLIASRDVRHPYPEELASSDSLESRSRWFLLQGDRGVVTIDCSGTFREFDFADIGQVPRWKQLSSYVGPEVRIAADPNLPDRIWTLDLEGVLRCLSLTNDRVLAEQKDAHAGGFLDLQVRSNGDVLTAGNDSAIRAWRLHDGSIAKVQEIQHDKPIVSVAVHEAQGLIGGVTVHGDILLFDLATGTLRKSFAPAGGANDKRPVRTGRLAFSPSGNYLSAFGQDQNCTTIDTQRLVTVQTADHRIGDSGGIDLCYSPAEETRFLTSSNGVSGNEIEPLGTTANSLVIRGGGPYRVVDFAIPEDEQRIVGLTTDGDIVFYSPEHFVQLSKIACPFGNPSSLAITAGNTSMVVASNQGNLYWCVLERRMFQLPPAKVLEGRIQRIDGLEGLGTVFAADLVGLRSIQDRQGSLTELMIANGVSEKSPNNRLFKLRKREGRWVLEPLRFDGDDQGPCERASLFVSPTGEEIAIIRQGQPELGAYDGRLLLAHESNPIWQSEVVQKDGNAGFSPFPLFAPDASVKSLLHFDFEWQRLLAHHRDPATGEWSRSTLAGNLGFGSRIARNSSGITQVITRHARGFDCLPPYRYIQIDAPGGHQFEAARGAIPWVNKSGQLFSYEPRDGSLWRKLPAGGWQEIAKLPFDNAIQSIPSLDHHDQMWWVKCMGRYLLVARRDFAQLEDNQNRGWDIYKIKLDRTFSKSIQCTCNMNLNGVLEVLLFQSGESPILEMVEVPVPGAAHP